MAKLVGNLDFTKEFSEDVLPVLKTQARIASQYLYSKKPLVNLSEEYCGFCQEDGKKNLEIFNPFQTNCGHVYCYYCVKSRLMDNPSLKCPRCLQIISNIVRKI
jgi:peroxin-2